MKFPYTKLGKISNAVSKAKDAPTSLKHVNFDADRGELQASDSFIAVRVPVQPEKADRTGLLMAEQVVVGEQVPARKADHVKLAKGEKAFPDLPSFWPTDAEMRKATQPICINVELLRKAAEAVGANKGHVEVIFLGVDKPVLVRPILKSDAPEIGADISRRDSAQGVTVPEALVMPLRPTQEVEELAKATQSTKSTKSTKSTTATASVSAIADDEDVSSLTPGQKAARTKRLAKEAAAAAAPKNGKKATSKGADIGEALKQAVGAAATKAKAKPAASTNGKAKATWTPEVLAERARKAAETRKRNAELAAAGK